jgi:hypothetical protein
MKDNYYSALDALCDTMDEMERKLRDFPSYPGQAEKDKALEELDALAAKLSETILKNAAEGIEPRDAAAREKTWKRINHVRNMVAGKPVDELPSEE